jgi:hypothetical protein
VFKHLGRRSSAGRKRKAAAVAVFALACVIGLGAYAFTASNTIPPQTAGGGANEVTGYTETGASYTWSVNDEYITAVEFYLKGKLKPSDVAVSLSTAAKPAAEEWVDCPAGNVSEAAAEKFLVKCDFLASKGVHKSLTELSEDYKWIANGVPNKEGNELSVSAVSEGVAIVEGA